MNKIGTRRERERRENKGANERKKNYKKAGQSSATNQQQTTTTTKSFLSFCPRKTSTTTHKKQNKTKHALLFSSLVKTFVIIPHLIYIHIIYRYVNCFPCFVLFCLFFIARLSNIALKFFFFVFGFSV